MPSSNIPVPDRDLGTSPSRKSSVDDLRRQNSKLKSDLEAERTKLRQVMRDKALESKRVQDNFEKEKLKAIELATKRLTTEHAAELRKIRESVAKEKENELRQMLKFKDEEVKTLKQHISEEKEKNRAAEEELRRILVKTSKEGEDHTESERKLRSEIVTLKEQKQKAEEMYRLKASAESEQVELIRRMKADHELELQKFIKDSKRESVQNLQHRRLTEKALEEKQHELAHKDQLARKLEAEKGDLQRRISLTGEFGRSSPKTSGSFDTSLEDSLLVKKDRERELKKKNAELQGKVESLERKCAVLEKENARSGNLKSTFIAEEKVKKLKKRNSELVSIARQLEDKAKKLQEEKVTAQKLAEDINLNNAVVEHVKRMYARQRAKDLAEHAKTLMTKEKELEEVKKQLAQPQNSQMSRIDKVEELHSIIRQSAKERLWLERQISSGECSRTPSPQLLHGDAAIEMVKKAEAIAVVEAENKNLKASVSELKKVEAESLKLAEELKGKQEENQKLVNDLEEKQTRCSKLELERERFAAKSTMLQKKNIEMGKRLKELEEVETEVVAANEKLKVAEQSNVSLSIECKKLKSQMEELLQVKEDLKNMEKQKEKIEQEYLASVEKLKERQEEIRQLHKIQEEANRAHEMAVTSLEDTVRSLEQKCIDAEENNINLKKEVEELRGEEWLRKRKREDLCHKSTQTMSESFSVVSPAVHKEEPGVKEKERNSINLKPSSVIRPSNARHPVSVQPETKAEANSKKSTTTAEPIEKSDDILEGLSSRINELAASDSGEDDTYSEQLHGETENIEVHEDKSKKPETDLEALSRRINQVAVSDDTSTSSSSISRERHGSQGSQDLTSMADGDLGDMEDNQPDSSAPEDEQTDHSDRPVGKLNSHDTEPSGHNKILSAVVRNGKTAEEGVLDSGYREGDSDVDPAIHEKLAVYIARYSYDPVQHSPNESPETELAFQAGDYLYVFGEMDEDGYFLGELMSGQRGLVPSNFVEKVADESDMNMMVNGTEEGIDDITDSSDEEETDGKLHRALRQSLEHIPDVALDDITEEEEDDEDDELSLSEDEDNEDGSIADAVTSDTDLEPFRVPSPRRLVLERQFTRSVLLSWKPADLPADQVKGYGVYVEGELRLMLKGASKTKALLEDIDTDKTYRISVRTITTTGEESWDRSAVVEIGRDASLAPSHVHITCVSPTSANIEWSPGNSSFSHEIIVNGTIHRTVRPGTFQHTLTNLEPDHAYKVLVRAKNPRQSLDYDNEADLQVDSLTAKAEFRTEPGGHPDPPLDVEVVEGDSNSLHVNWIPITITEKGTSNGARVTGYKLYINGFPCTEVTSPTADCVTVVSWMVERAVKRSHSEVLCLVVRTQSGEGESTDSNEVRLPVKMFNFKVDEFVKPKGVEAPRQKKEFSSSAEQSVNGVDSVSDQTDSVRGDSRDESGQAKVGIVDELPRSFNHGQGEPGSLPQPRTKGEPVVWRYDLSEDSEIDVGEDSEIVDSAKKSEDIFSEDDEDEQVEICYQEVPGGSANSTEPIADVNTDGSHPLEEENKEEADVPEAEQHVVEPREGRDGPEEASQSTGKMVTVKPQVRRKDSDQSVVSDIDMEEFERSLDEAEVIPRRKHDEDDGEDKKPFIRPLEYEESDFEDESSEQALLSIIQEEDEEDLTESQALVSRVSQSHSASEGFLSDDDVMDLLDEDHVRQKSSSYSVDIGSVRRISQNDDPSTWNMERPEGVVSGGDDLGLARYLAKSQDDPRSDISVESHDHLLDNIELEECDGEGVKSEEKDETYSDTEADHGEVERSSTPVDNEQDTANPESYAAVGGQPSNDHMNNSGGLVSDEPMRVFMAVYDYDPATMSPNPDAEEEELAFKEGDLIKVYGDKDEDGFYWGELDGRAGFIPFNMVSEVQLEDEESGSAVTSPSLNLSQDPVQPLEQSLQSQSLQEDETDGSILEEEGYEDPRFSANYQLPPRRMVALFNYDPNTLSPNPDSEVELRFRVGDVIMVYGDMDEDGFYSGELRGVRGLVPSNFLEDLSENLEPVSQDTSHESSLDSSPEKLNTPNGTHVMVEADTPKKKKGIFSKGKQMFKKIAKGHNSPRASGSKR